MTTRSGRHDFVVLIRAQGCGPGVIRVSALRDQNPGILGVHDEERLRAHETVKRLGLEITRTRDTLCRVCREIVGEGSLKCWACQHADEGPGYRVGQG